MFKPCDVEHFLLRSSWWAMTHSSDTNSKRNEDSFRRPSLDSFLRSPLNAEDTYATLTPNHKFTLLSMIKFAYGIHPRRETLPLPRCHLSSLSLKRLCHFMLEAFDSRVRVQDCGADPDVRFFLGIDPSDGYAASILCCAARLSTDSTAYATHVLVELLCTHRYARTRELLHRGADAWKRNAVEAVCREGRVTEKKRKLQTRTLECILTPVETQERWVFVAFAAVVLHQCAAVAAGGAQMENDFMEILERSNIRVDLNQYRLAAREKEMKSARSCVNRDKRRINLSKVNKCCLSSVHPGILSSLRVQKETLTSSELLTSALSVETRKRKQSQGPWFQFCKEGDEVEEEEGEIMMEAIRDWLLEAESKALKNDLAMPLPLENIPAGVLEGGGSQFKNSSIQENVTQMEEEEKDDLFIYEDCEGSETESP